MFKLLAVREAVNSFISAFRDPVNSFKAVKQDFLSWLFSLKFKFFETKEKLGDLLNTNIELGLYHFYNLDFSEASFRFNLVSVMKPDSYLVHYHKSRCLFYQGKISEAKKSLDKSLKLNPNYAPALFYLAKIHGDRGIKTIPVEIVQEYFDHVAPGYVKSQVIDGRYNGHNFLYRIMLDYFAEKISGVSYLDLGCGTGVCGQFLRLKNAASMITGVDVSTRMLKVTDSCAVDEVKVYDKLFRDDIMAFKPESQYDVISLMDVCDYIGDAEHLLMKIKSFLCKNGIIVGAVRQSVSEEGYVLNDEQGCNFFSFSKKYLEETFSKCGLEILFFSGSHLYNGVLYWCWVVR